MPRDSVSLNLDDELRDKIEYIKEQYGHKFDTEALRLAINDCYKIAKKRAAIFNALEREERDNKTE